jgi:5-methylcytosine-specific restriction endonuclease McrA
MTETQQPPLSQSEEKELKRIEYHREYRRKNAKAIAEKAKAKYDANRESILAQKKEYAKRTTEIRKVYLKKHYAQNKERILALAKESRKVKKAELAVWQRAYRKANPELSRERDRQYYEKHRQRNLEVKSKWGKTPEGKIKQKAKNQTRRARKNLVPHSLSVADLKDLRGKSKGACFYCRQKSRLSLDHIIPISKGGPHSRDNVVMACRSCNSSKGAKEPLRFAKERGLLLI